MASKNLWLPGLALLMTMPGAAAVFNARQFGATGNGKTKDTMAIRKAVTACEKAGGGVVYFPPGKYLTGSIRLKSNVTLQIEAGAVILGSPDVEDYPLVPDPWNPSSRELSALIYGSDLERVTITGRGAIDGQGQVWWHRQRLARARRPADAPKTAQEREEAAKVKFGRPRLIKLVRCRNVLIENLTLLNSATWTVNPVFSEDVTVRGLTIRNPPDSPNTDGINPESCRNVHISNCNIDVGDDCVTIKSGANEAGRRVGRPCENITVTNCTMMHGHGGVVVGSEMSGGARNITVSNCVFQGTQRGIRLKSQRGRGGLVEAMVVSNIVMDDVGEPFTLNMYYQGAGSENEVLPVTESTPKMRDVLIHNILARGAKIAGQIFGLPESPFTGITFSNVRIAAHAGFSCAWCRDIVFRNVRIDTEAGPALSCRNTGNLELDEVSTAQPHAGQPVVDLELVKDVLVRACRAVPGTGTFLKVSGAASRNIILSGNYLSDAGWPYDIAPEVFRSVTMEK